MSTSMQRDQSPLPDVLCSTAATPTSQASQHMLHRAFYQSQCSTSGKCCIVYICLSCDVQKLRVGVFFKCLLDCEVLSHVATGQASYHK